MKKSLLGKPEYMARLPKHGFNLSYDFAYTSSVGMILPVLHDILNPKEKVNVSFNLETLSSYASVKPVMTDVDEYIDLFFVPFSKIFTPSLQLLANVDDITSSYLDDFKSKLQTGQIIPKLRVNAFTALAQNLISSWNQPDNGLTPNEYENLEYIYGSIRLLEHLGYNPMVWFGDIKDDGDYVINCENYTPDVSPAFLCAYQAIFYDYFRLSEFQLNYPKAYNLDSEINNYYVSLVPSIFKESVRLQYRAYKRDYFKNISRSPLQGSLGVLFSASTVTPAVNNTYLDNINIRPINESGTVSSAEPTSIAGVNTLNTSGIRRMFAYDKLLRISARAGKHYDDQIAAHFGVKVNTSYSNEVVHIGTHHQKLVFKSVVSTSDTSGSSGAALGQMAGRGVGLQGKNNGMTYVAPCHGVLMAVYSASPNVIYKTGLDKLNTMLSLYDFYQPEFDKLGQQPLYHYEFFANDAVATNRKGWQYRYQHLKLKYDRMTSAFQRYSNISLYDAASIHLPSIPAGGVFYNYVVEGNNKRMSDSSVLSYLTVNPHDLDDVLLVAYNPTVGISIDDLIDNCFIGNAWQYKKVMTYILSNLYTYTANDPFINNLHVTYYKTSTMSTFGEPDI